jgi:hypothetical protein
VLLRYDLDTGNVTEHAFGPGRCPSEAAFAPADNQPGGAGCLMSCVHDAPSGASDLVILDAADLAAPVATIRLPRRVPFGFHGNWLPDPSRTGALDPGRPMSGLLPLSGELAGFTVNHRRRWLHSRGVTREFSRTGGVWTLRGSAH